ncbi:hypothetical protein L0U85_04585 [Glycomyces sp. L485]|uniref:hypothetical protein n=1 Tax=Glycomyces sp. L485 TaxID=2909235 RepID=UPI001F4AFBE9|nr:hypothetical protein [Glycomyces sp. L485]MCH7230141.1 hypothetical protein [Glycomyces sp. L485]
MSGRIHISLDGTNEYELHCDRRGGRFRPGDDSYYSRPVLRAAAESEGRRVSQGSDGEHECPGRGDPAAARRDCGLLAT